MDRLSVHRSLRVKAVMDELGFKRILNASYCPNFNPIEGAIGICKNYIKRKRLNQILNEEKQDLNLIIEESVGHISQEVCVKFILKSNYLLNQFQ